MSSSLQIVVLLRLSLLDLTNWPLLLLQSRPRKAAVNPWARPPVPQQIPIPYPPGWQPADIGSGAVAAALA